jgi:hypothetical protein
MEQWQVILKAGIEGGSIALNGMHNGKCWFFSREVHDQTPEFIDEPNLFLYSKNVYSWEDALEMLDEHKWHLFFPLEVHPVFRGAILAAVLERRLQEKPFDTCGLHSWLSVCKEIPDVQWRLSM